MHNGPTADLRTAGCWQLVVPTAGTQGDYDNRHVCTFLPERVDSVVVRFLAGMCRHDDYHRGP